jgi:hypothetical protein
MSSNTYPHPAGSFDPAAGEGPKHRGAKNLLAELCQIEGMTAIKEVPVYSAPKTYHADVLVEFTILGKEVRVDLEIEDHDHSKHDFDDAVNKQRVMTGLRIKTVYFKANDLVGKKSLSTDAIFRKIYGGCIDGKEENPRMNI